MSDDADSRMAAFLSDHPRLMGALFTLVVLLTQAGSAVADGGGYSGP